MITGNSPLRPEPLWFQPDSGRFSVILSLSAETLNSAAFVIGAAAFFLRGNALATMATITFGMAMLGFAGWHQSQIYGQPIPVALSMSPIKSEEYRASEAVSGPPNPSPNDFQKPARIDITPSGRAALFAEAMASCEELCGEVFTWSEIQIQYRRYAKEHGWRMEIADRILSKALKDAGAIRGQRDLRAQGKGRPITITFPGLGP